MPVGRVSTGKGKRGEDSMYKAHKYTHTEQAHIQLTLFLKPLSTFFLYLLHKLRC